MNHAYRISSLEKSDARGLPRALEYPLPRPTWFTPAAAKSIASAATTTSHILATH
ncbi:hypothetical protein C7S15_4799 [Burkholderia cepacia]|nr:hypothetical protein [Burkholderia cepacia]